MRQPWRDPQWLWVSSMLGTNFRKITFHTPNLKFRIHKSCHVLRNLSDPHAVAGDFLRYLGNPSISKISGRKPFHFFVSETQGCDLPHALVTRERGQRSNPWEVNVPSDPIRGHPHARLLRASPEGMPHCLPKVSRQIVEATDHDVGSPLHLTCIKMPRCLLLR